MFSTLQEQCTALNVQHADLVAEEKRLSKMLTEAKAKMSELERARAISLAIRTPGTSGFTGSFDDG